MPHRTTYFFPRQFPDRSGFDASSKQVLDHEKKITKDAFNIEKDLRKSSSISKDPYSSVSSFPVGKKTSSPPSVTTTTPTTTPISDLFTSSDDEKYQKEKKPYGEDDKYQKKKKQLAAFFDWLTEKKLEKTAATHVKLKRLSADEDRHLLITPEPEPEPEPDPEPVLPVPEKIKDRDVDRNFDRQVSLPRLSSGSSYAGSLFSGITTLDGTFSSDVKLDTATTVLPSTTTQDVVQEEEKEEKEKKEENLALKTKESYYLQLGLAKRLGAQAGLASELVLLQEGVPEASDAQTVSYRLWVPIISLSHFLSSGFPENGIRFTFLGCT